MYTALRPYMTTGMAIVGASVIAVAPITVPPPDLPTVEVVAADAVRTVSADVELTALLDALIAAVPQAATATAQFFLQNLPAGVMDSLAAGRFARVLTIAAVVPAAALSIPLAPFVNAFAGELPLPLGTFDGVIQQGFFFANALPSIVIDVLTLAADVVDGVLSPADFPDAALGAITTRVTMAIESFQKIVAAIGGALPLTGFELQTLAVVEESPDIAVEPETAEFSSQSVSSATLSAPADTVTVTVDPQAAGNVGNSPTEGASQGVVEDELQDAPEDDDGETRNGGTDLTDGNQAQPGITGEQESAVEDDGPGAVTTDDTTAETAATDDTAGETTDNDAGSADSGGAEE